MDRSANRALTLLVATMEPPSPARQRSGQRPHRQPHPFGVDAHHPVPLFGAGVEEHAGMADSGRDRDHPRDADPPDGGGRGRVDLVGVGDVALDVGSGEVPGEDVGPGSALPLRHRGADARAAADDHRGHRWRHDAPPSDSSPASVWAICALLGPAPSVAVFRTVIRDCRPGTSST